MKQEAFIGNTTPSKQLKALYRKRAVKNISLKAYAQDIIDVSGEGFAIVLFSNKAGANNAKKKPKKVLEKKMDDKKVTKRR